MKSSIQIIARRAPAEAVSAVEGAFHAAGLETMLFAFGDDPDRNAEVAVQIAEGQVSGAHPLQVWIVPATFVELESAAQERARTARELIGLPPKTDGQRRLLITLDPIERASADDAGIISLLDLVDGRVSAEQLRIRFD